MVSDRLPIIIAGAGPAGLVAALVLQNHGIPFLIVEKVSRSELCSNMGAGFDLAPAALNILLHRLRLSEERTNEMLSRYDRWRIATMQGDLVKNVAMPQTSKEDYACAHRAGVQKCLLDQLLQDAKASDFLKCNAMVEFYTEHSDQVRVTLNDGSVIVGKALLGCDGIHSRVRSCMNDAKEDSLEYLGVTCFWGKCSSDGAKNDNDKYDPNTFVWLLGTRKVPGSFFVTPFNGENLWVLSFPSVRTRSVLTRDTLSEASKIELLNTLRQSGTILDPRLESMISETPANEISQSGLFDRVNSDLPYSSPGKLVALLGDSGHPQSPYLQQGINSAITDAYVLATKLAEVSVQEAISFYDSAERREEMKNLVVVAREQAIFLNSKNWIVCWILRSFLRYAPIDAGELKRYDYSNKNMVSRLEGVRAEVGHGDKMKSLVIVSMIVVVIAVGLGTFKVKS